MRPAFGVTWRCQGDTTVQELELSEKALFGQIIFIFVFVFFSLYIASC